MMKINKTALLQMLVFTLFVVVSVSACSAQSGTEENQSEGTGAQQAQIDFEWSADADCAACHSAEGASSGDSACLASAHVGDGISCSSCHSDEASLAAAHADVGSGDNQPTALTTTSVGDDVCLSCHESDHTAQATAEVTVLTDENGLVINPHDLPQNDDHATITCVNCHQVHSGEPIATTAPNVCISCHHENVYECNTCHSA